MFIVHSSMYCVKGIICKMPSVMQLLAVRASYKKGIDNNTSGAIIRNLGLGTK